MIDHPIHPTPGYDHTSEPWYPFEPLPRPGAVGLID